MFYNIISLGFLIVNGFSDLGNILVYRVNKEWNKNINTY
jgi:hypothetical protein